MTEAIIAGFLIGLGGSLHCVGMCGAIVTAFSFGQSKQSFGRSTVTTITYNLGRISTYTVLGILAGLFGQALQQLGFMMALRIAAGILMILIGLYTTQWWQGLKRIEAIGQPLWNKVKPLTAKLSPNRSLPHAYFAGILWGLIPCGLVYGALSVAVAQGSTLGSAILMFSFGLGTFLPLVLMGLGFSHMAHFLKLRWVRYSLAFSMIAFGLVTLAMLFAHQGHGGDMQHDHKEETKTEMQHQHH